MRIDTFYWLSDYFLGARYMEQKRMRARVSHLLSSLRTKENISVRELEERVGIKKSHLSDLENKKVDPKIEDLMALHKYMGIKLWELVSYIEEGSGEVEDWRVNMANPGDKYAWLRKYTYLHWLSDVVTVFCELPDDVRRKLISKLRREKGLIELLVSAPSCSDKVLRLVTVITEELKT